MQLDKLTLGLFLYKKALENCIILAQIVAQSSTQKRG
jgi:hypothetical protein